VAIVAATFFFLLPKIADYRDVWDVVKTLSWEWLVVFAGVVVLNLATYAPPWLVVLPQLRFFQAMELTQASTALSLVLPAGTAAGLGVSFGMLQSWGLPRREITRGMTLVSLWNQFLNLFFPIVAVFLLTARGEDTKLLATAAFIGVAILGVVVAGFALALASSRLANDVGEVAARLANWALGKARRGPVGWGGPSFERFRASAGELLRRRWHVLTLSSLVGSLSVYLVLLVCLRALDVPASEVSAVEAFAAWSLVRLLGTIPITPGGVGVVELALTTALIAFGGNNAGVVASVLVYRFLTMAPTLVYGLIAAGTWRRHRPPPEATPPQPVGAGVDTTLRR
jgi:putative heme transporter